MVVNETTEEEMKEGMATGQRLNAIRMQASKKARDLKETNPN